MENGRWQRYASKQVTAWSKRTLPGWWTMFTFVLGIGFFLYLAHAMIADDPEPRSPIVAGTRPTASSEPTAPPASTPPTSTPTQTPTTTQTPETPETPGTPGSGDGETVPVLGPGGGKVRVDKGAAELARLSFAALYDPAAAAAVPTSSGGVHTPPAQKLPGSVSKLTWTNPGAAGDENRLQFSAVVDPDGAKGSLRATTAFVVVADFGDGWVFLNTAA